LRPFRDEGVAGDHSLVPDVRTERCLFSVVERRVARVALSGRGAAREHAYAVQSPRLVAERRYGNSDCRIRCGPGSRGSDREHHSHDRLCQPSPLISAVSLLGRRSVHKKRLQRLPRRFDEPRRVALDECFDAYEPQFLTLACPSHCSKLIRLMEPMASG